MLLESELQEGMRWEWDGNEMGMKQCTYTCICIYSCKRTELKVLDLNIDKVQRFTSKIAGLWFRGAIFVMNFLFHPPWGDRGDGILGKSRKFSQDRSETTADQLQLQVASRGKGGCMQAIACDSNWLTVYVTHMLDLNLSVGLLQCDNSYCFSFATTSVAFCDLFWNMTSSDDNHRHIPQAHLSDLVSYRFNRGHHEHPGCRSYRSCYNSRFFSISEIFLKPMWKGDLPSSDAPNCLGMEMNERFLNRCLLFWKTCA